MRHRAVTDESRFLENKGKGGDVRKEKGRWGKESHVQGLVIAELSATISQQNVSVLLFSTLVSSGKNDPMYNIFLWFNGVPRSSLTRRKSAS